MVSAKRLFHATQLIGDFLEMYEDSLEFFETVPKVEWEKYIYRSEYIAQDLASFDIKSDAIRQKVNDLVSNYKSHDFDMDLCLFAIRKWITTRVIDLACKDGWVYVSEGHYQRETVVAFEVASWRDLIRDYAANCEI